MRSGMNVPAGPKRARIPRRQHRTALRACAALFAAAALVLAIIGLATRSWPASAGDLGGPGYLALGDSIAFGYQPPAVIPAADYRDPANFTGYPEDVATALGLDVANASCPGETTSSMIKPGAPSNGCETNAQDGPGYRSFFPLHVSYDGSQLRYAVWYLQQHPKTQLVTIGIGANDLFRCQETTADDCAGPELRRVLTRVTANLDTILNALRNQGHYRRTLVVLTYYALNYGDQAAVTQIEALNAALVGPAARYGAHLADGFAAFAAASARAGGNTCTAGLRIRLPSGGCDLHPTAYGQRVLATAIQEAIGRPMQLRSSAWRPSPAGVPKTMPDRVRAPVGLRCR